MNLPHGLPHTHVNIYLHGFVRLLPYAALCRPMQTYALYMWQTQKGSKCGILAVSARALRYTIRILAKNKFQG